jgi:hypothetical protein
MLSAAVAASSLALTGGQKYPGQACSDEMPSLSVFFLSFSFLLPVSNDSGPRVTKTWHARCHNEDGMKLHILRFIKFKFKLSDLVKNTMQGTLPWPFFLKNKMK